MFYKQLYFHKVFRQPLIFCIGTPVDLTQEEFKLYIPLSCYQFPDWLKQKVFTESDGQYYITWAARVYTCYKWKLKVQTVRRTGWQRTLLSSGIKKGLGVIVVTIFWEVEPKRCGSSPGVWFMKNEGERGGGGGVGEGGWPYQSTVKIISVLRQLF